MSHPVRPALRAGSRGDGAHLLSALWIVLLYAVFAGLWIYFSDTLMATIVRNPEAWVRFSVLKGFLFIAVTGTFLYLLIARRIRRIRRITSELSESEARLRSYVENAPVAILVFDREGRCAGANRAALELTGAQGSLGGRHISEILPPADGGARPGLDDEGEKEILRADGRRMWVHVRAVRLEGGQSLLFCQDISERILAEEELRRANERLVQAEKMEAVGRLAGGVAHDFNNILTAIYGYTDVLHGSLPTHGEARSFVAEIRKAAARAAALTQQLLTFSRRQEHLPRPVDLNRLLRDLLPMLERLIGEDVGIDLDLGEDLWTVHADPARLEQALVNLAVNGRDAMPRGGKLTLRTRNVTVESADGVGPRAGHLDAGPGKYVAVTVSDTGVGMDAQTRSHLFEPFFTTKDVGKGTGLGLATVFGIVKQSGGSITFRSEPGQGTSFTLYLPRTEGSFEHAEERPDAPRTAAAGHELILYVEDDEAVRSLVTMVLERNGYEVLCAPNGVEALRAAAPVIDRIALVIADVVMPLMNGRELVDRLRSLRHDLKFVFTSGYTRDIVARHDILESGTSLIEKPIDAVSLLAKIREILDS